MCEPTDVGEVDGSCRAVDVYTEVERTSCVGKGPVPLIHKARMQPKVMIRPSTERSFASSTEVGIWVDQADSARRVEVCPSPTHKCTVEVGLSAGQQRVGRRRSEESDHS